MKRLQILQESKSFLRFCVQVDQDSTVISESVRIGPPDKTWEDNAHPTAASVPKVSRFFKKCQPYIGGSCIVPNASKIDCGHSGTTQGQCLQKGCCWHQEPHTPANIPWCYFPAGSHNCFLLDNDPDTPPFTEDELSKVKQYYLKNIDIDGKGGVAASPETQTPCSGSYYYHWQRDGGLSMRLRMLIGSSLSDYQQQMEDYTQFVLKVQSEPDPNQIDVRIEPKFMLPNGEVFSGGWCRPQTDGPAIRSITLMLFAQELIKNGQMDYVKQYLYTGDETKYHGGAIKYDLEWISHNWETNGCDLWEEVRSDDFFWNRMFFKKALYMGADFASQMKDPGASKYYGEAAGNVNGTLSRHWNGEFVFESDSRQKDSAVIMAFSDAFSTHDNLFDPTSFEVASTVNVYNNLFCATYPINQQDTKNGIPGILYGRYAGDGYCGGNPWILSSASLAELFYRGAMWTTSKGLPDKNALDVWKNIFSVDPSKSLTKDQLAQLFVRAGDGVLKRIVYHVKGNDMHMAEQLDKNTGAEASATDLTWSYANALKANVYRTLAMEMMEK